MTEIQKSIVQVALGDVGRTDAAYFRTGPGEDWCAYFVAMVLERAGCAVPGPRDRARRGALAQPRWLAARGRWALSPANARHITHPGKGAESTARADLAAEILQPADVICWRASRVPLDWRGHIAIIIAASDLGIPGAIEIVHGNARGKVRREVYGPDRWPWLRAGGLAGVARICAQP
jgi:hypothetical protein